MHKWEIHTQLMGFDKAAKLANYLKVEQIMRKVAT